MCYARPIHEIPSRTDRDAVYRATPVNHRGWFPRFPSVDVHHGLRTFTRNDVNTTSEVHNNRAHRVVKDEEKRSPGMHGIPLTYTNVPKIHALAATLQRSSPRRDTCTRCLCYDCNTERRNFDSRPPRLRRSRGTRRITIERRAGRDSRDVSSSGTRYEEK